MSRTVVKPRNSVASASRAASSAMKPMSAVNISCIAGAAIMLCQWASIRPGMRTRPRPSMRVTSACGADSRGALMRSIVWPRTRTSDGPLSTVLVPSSTRTPANSVASDMELLPIDAGRQRRGPVG